MELTQTRVNDEVWLVDRFRIRFKARLGLIKGFNREVLSTYRNFRKFSTESSITFAEPVQ